jgi:VanZ family protein
MSVIFCSSADAGSGLKSKLIVQFCLDLLHLQVGPELFDKLVLLLRKAAHLGEFSILGLLVWRLLRVLPRLVSPSELGQTARLAAMLCLLYAATDEFHQLYVPNREGKVSDVLIDTCGASVGIVLAWFATRRRLRLRP